MKTRRTLLQLLMLVGCVILLLDTRYRVLATYRAACGHYNTPSNVSCPKPCELSYPSYPYLGAGPFYQQLDVPACNEPTKDDCTTSTEVYVGAIPGYDPTYCGCGALGQFCTGDTDCCGSDLCEENGFNSECVICLTNGQGCLFNSNCCSGYCGDDGFCCSSDLGEACGTSADCCTLAAQCPHGLCCIPTGMSGCSVDQDCCDSSAHCENGTCKCGMTVPAVGAGFFPPFLR
jgi:hypothetical protein